MSGDPIVAVPVDLDVEDRLAGPVTFRMAAWLAIAASGTALVIVEPSRPLAVAGGVLLGMIGLVGAWCRPGGRAASAWLLPLWHYRRRRHADDAGSVTSADVAEPRPPVVPEPDEEVLLRPPRQRRPVLPAVAAAVGLAVVLASSARWMSWRGDGPRQEPPLPPAAPALPAPAPASPPRQVVVVPLIDPLWWWEGDDSAGLDHDCFC